MASDYNQGYNQRTSKGSRATSILLQVETRKHMSEQKYIR